MTLTAMLMAGGESRRMGTDKAALVFNGETLWERQLRLLKSLEPQTLCLSARARPAWCPDNVETILDASPSRGPLSGIAAGLSHIHTSHLLVLAVDMPRMSLEHLNKLTNLAQPGCGVVPVKNDLFEPLCAIYPYEAVTTAMKVLARGDTALQSFIQALRAAEQVRTYPLSEFEFTLYQNLNTPGDLMVTIDERIGS